LEKWGAYAFLYMFFAGFTAAIAKLGLVGISSDLDVTIRTLFVSVFVVLFALCRVPAEELGTVDRHNIFWLVCPALQSAQIK
jgi:transporter family protein